MPALKLGHCVMSSWGQRSPCLMASRAACAGRKTVSDNYMTGPGAHENAAMSAVVDGRIEEAQALAILALASAVNRLAAAQEAIANV
jgi:hypothetical protein